MKDTSEATTIYYCGVSLNSWGKNYDIKNNIIISNEDRGHNYLIRSANTTTRDMTFTSDNNVFYLRAGSTKATITRTFTTLEEYQTTTLPRAGALKDVNSKYSNVEFASEATGDLHIAGTSVRNANLAVPMLAAVTTDIDGETRQSETYAGADQSTLPFITTSLKDAINSEIKIVRTLNGFRAEFTGEADVLLYNANGMLVDKARVNNTYSKELNSGVYILKVNGEAVKLAL